MLRSELSQAVKDAMRAKDKRGLSTIRLIMAAIKDRDIAVRSEGNQEGVSDAEVLQLMQKMIKQRHESIKMYQEAGRLELAQQEQDEIGVIEGFMPLQLSEDEIAVEVDKVMAEIGATTVKDMGRLMTVLRERYAGKMDFGRASGVAKSRFA
ncbi:MAG: GatB/YqeY domain-containing protein [Alphaproteobacteria bacterium]|jgi:uncharacterized protein YqeY